MPKNPGFIIQYRYQYLFRGNVTAEGYRHFLVNEISEVLDNKDLIWYQQDDTPIHQTV